jgi:protein-tyrosine phosphatase
MIDIHSHILWGLDDGAKTLDESVEMLRLAVEGGTTDIVATPHANYRYRYEEAVVDQRIRELTLATEGRPVIHRGCDFHLSFDNIQDAVAQPGRYTIARGPYLLVEFPDTSLRGFGQALETLMARGLTLIMTHPERQPDLQKLNGDFVEWVGLGCLVQLTGQSLLGRFGKKAEESAWEMIDRGVAHFVASDAHGVRDRNPRLDEAFAAVERRAGRETAETLFLRNPGAVLAGKPLPAPFAGAPRRRPWYQLFR